MPALASANSGHDDVAGPGVEELLQPRRSARSPRRTLGARRPGQLGRGLLAEQPERLGGLLQVSARRRVRVGQQAMTRPTTTGSTPDLRNATQAAIPMSRYSDAVPDAARPQQQDHGEERPSRQASATSSMCSL